MFTTTMSSELAFRALTEDHLRTFVPSIYTERAAPRTSNHYNHLSTATVLEHLKDLGWVPVKAVEMKLKVDVHVRDGFQKHIIRLRNPQFFIGNDADNIEALPELVMTNSHDGRAAFNFYAGLYRVVCNNGMVMSAVDFANMYIRHRKFSFEDLLYVANEMSMMVPNIIDKIETMKGIYMTFQEKKAFATDMIRARWDYNYRPDLSDLLKPIREEDEGDDMWSVFNILQEKLTKGGFIGAGHRKTKKLTDPNRELNVNKKLYLILEPYLDKHTKKYTHYVSNPFTDESLFCGTFSECQTFKQQASTTLIVSPLDKEEVDYLNKHIA